MDGRAATQLLDEGIRTWGVPGAQLGLLRGDDRVTVCSGSTSIGGPPVTVATSFHAGSLAKALTGLVVLDAARAGHLDLDAPGDAHGPGLWPESARTLLSQTSGRANVLPEADEELAAFVSRAAALPRVHPPGRFSYCNAGWSALDLLLRRTTGSSFEDLATRLLGPSTTFGMPEHGAEGHEVGPGTDPRPVPATYAPAASAAGSRWWATADQLLDHALLHLHDGQGRLHPDDVRAVRTPTAELPGRTVFDAWGLGWATWDRGEHRAFGWAGYTGGHRAFLRCFPDQDAALVLLANAAGPLFGPPGGSALFDTLLPDLLDLLDVPPLPPPSYDAPPRPAAELAGGFGPLLLEALDDDHLGLHAQAFGVADPLTLERLGGNTFDVVGEPPGSTPLAVADDLLHLGPFALPRG
ncbi:hypothetical protein ASG49_06695 [Marmoricola sp. Leaf446]|uniref:serine hydrolase domain-containing protein n=1 Tax=Marmoricola sp. Leaf446 TaxID=1736379 RepID=UPI0006FF90A3|nr:serine hydrolase domain-containing protein [Marmoricola sp. Leaf446]KQT94541.1 hypothetical protein ASG49_06695 [Marmoricola sp. Leaf446]